MGESYQKALALDGITPPTVGNHCILLDNSKGALKIQAACNAKLEERTRKKNKKKKKKKVKRQFCHFYLKMPSVGNFDTKNLCGMIIGADGSNTRDIWLATGASVRIRGKGSGHLEVEGKYEAQVPLMLSITET